MKGNIEIDFTSVGTDKNDRKHFVAAAFALGFEMAENTSGITNVYSKAKSYERGEPGDVSFLLSTALRRISINAFVEVWLDPNQALNDAEGLPARILSANDAQKLIMVSDSFELTYMKAAIAHIRHYSKGLIRLPDVYEPSGEEIAATEFLDDIQQKISKASTERFRRNIALLVTKHWKPAMVAWIKAYRGHLLELEHLWKEAPESISIDTGGRFPLIIPRGPKFKQMLERWT
jgi:hypothetical protein